MSISLSIVEDLDEVREGLKQFISLSPEFKVLDTFKTGEEAVYSYSKTETGYCDHGYQFAGHEWH